MKHGLHGALNGVDYKLVSTFGWSLWSLDPAPGFTRRPGKTGFYRAVDKDMPCFDIDHRGTYRGIPVDVGSSTGPQVTLSSSDRRAGAAGFIQKGRAEWMRVADRSDPELQFEEVRTPVPAPWFTSD